MTRLSPADLTELRDAICEALAAEEPLDPTTPWREAQWDVTVATLCQIDPGSPNSACLSNPG